LEVSNRVVFPQDLAVGRIEDADDTVPPSRDYRAGDRTECAVLAWTLPTNLGEGLTILVAVLFGATLPILPVQILWINLTTGVLLGTVLTFELKEPDEVYKAPITTSQGAVVMQLKEKMGVTRDDFAKERANIMRALQQAKAIDAVSRYVADLKRAAGDKIKFEPRFADEPKQGSEE